MDEPVVNKLAAEFAGTVLQVGSIGQVHLPPVSIPPVRVPRQLPPDPIGFVNRAGELDALGRLLDGRARVVVVSGMGGVGKTGLGVHWAHSVSDWFDGGQLYADLGSLRHGGGVEVGDVLGGFLRALGVREDWIPVELAERAAMYRSIVAQRRVLVLLDDVDQPAQVPPLVPGSAGSMVIVTSRHRLAPLLVSGATLLPVEPLEIDEGVRLIDEMLGDSRVTDEPEAASELVRLCGRLPIALRVCGARLVGRRHGIARLSADLADERRRLTRLTAEGMPIVEAVFDAAYSGLPEPAAALYRGLGSHPGPEFSLAVAAMIAGRDRDGALDLVETLHSANLLEEIGEDRYRFHDLVRLHARARSGGNQGLTRRIVEWYLRQAKAADWAVLGPNRLRLADPVEDSEFFATPAAALGWLEMERTNVLAAVRAAADEHWDELVWQFGEALWALFDNRKHHADELEVARLGVDAARRRADRPAEARMRNHVVRALLRAGDLDRAAAELTAALDAAASGNRRVEAAVIESSGFVWLGQGDHGAATDAFARSKVLNAAHGTPRGTALQGYHLGLALAAAGRHDAAAAELTWAMETLVAESDELSEGKIGIQLGEIYQALGRTDEAVAVLTRAVAIMAHRDLPLREAEALDLLAEVCADPDEATRCRQRAAALRAVVADAE